MRTRYLTIALTAVVLLAIAGAGSLARSQGTPSARADSVYAPILVYHGIFPHHPGQTQDQKDYDVSPEVFEAQMAYLKEHEYHVISLSSLIDALEKHEAVPEHSVVLTFDDGQSSHYQHAFPVLKKYGFTATFFVYPNPIEDSHSGFATWDQLREMQRAGMSMQSHTYTHPKLTKSPDKAKPGEVSLKNELELSKKVIEKRIGAPVDLLAYPFGLHNAHVDSAVRAAGYRAARGFATPAGGWNSASTLFNLRTFMVRDDVAGYMKRFEALLEPSKPKSTP